MPGEHIIPLTTRAAALRHSLAEMRARAEEAVFRLVLICTLLGYRMVRPDGTAWPEDRAGLLHGSGDPLPTITRMLPGGAVAAGRAPAALLHS